MLQKKLWKCPHFAIALCEGVFILCLTLLNHLRLLTFGGKNINSLKTNKKKTSSPGTSAFIPNIQPGPFLLRE